MQQSRNGSDAPARTGISGLDGILGGGLPPKEIHVIRGGPGAGKTTLGLQFLREGVLAGESALLVSFTQNAAALEKMAAGYGWRLDGIEVEDLSGGERAPAESEQTLFHTAYVELRETVDALFAAIRRVRPARVVLDSITTLRLLSDSPVRYRRQLVAIRAFLAAHPCTVLVLDGSPEDLALDDAAHGVIALERIVPEYGNVRRRLLAVKMRGIGFHGGYHTFRIGDCGIEVYPRLEPSRGGESGHRAVLTSGVPALDGMLGGGLEQGTACLIIGSTGTGKTTLATLHAYEAARRGDRAALFCFDERPETLLLRAKGIGMDLAPLVDAGMLTLRSISTAELAPGEFSQIVREAVERDAAQVVVMDSLTGYFHAMPQEEALLAQMHDLLAYLGQHGVLSLLVVTQHGLLGDRPRGPLDVSYMADAVILLRHGLIDGELRKIISVVKKRSGGHETTLRELTLSARGVAVSGPVEAGAITLGPNGAMLRND